MPVDLNDPALIRIRRRPTPDLWKPDEPLTLAEAAALLFPLGPVGLGTLRRARKQGQLATRMVCNRLYTTVDAVRAMTLPVIMPDPLPPPETATPATLPRSLPESPEQRELLALLASRKKPKTRTKA